MCDRPLVCSVGDIDKESPSPDNPLVPASPVVSSFFSSFSSSSGSIHGDVLSLRKNRHDLRQQSPHLVDLVQRSAQSALERGRRAFVHGYVRHRGVQHPQAGDLALERRIGLAAGPWECDFGGADFWGARLLPCGWPGQAQGDVQRRDIKHDCWNSDPTH